MNSNIINARPQDVENIAKSDQSNRLYNCLVVDPGLGECSWKGSYQNLKMHLDSQHSKWQWPDHACRVTVQVMEHYHIVYYLREGNEYFWLHIECVPEELKTNGIPYVRNNSVTSSISEITPEEDHISCENDEIISTSRKRVTVWVENESIDSNDIVSDCDEEFMNILSQSSFLSFDISRSTDKDESISNSEATFGIHTNESTLIAAKNEEESTLKYDININTKSSLKNLTDNSMDGATISRQSHHSSRSTLPAKGDILIPRDPIPISQIKFNQSMETLPVKSSSNTLDTKSTIRDSHYKDFYSTGDLDSALNTSLELSSESVVVVRNAVHEPSSSNQYNNSNVAGSRLGTYYQTVQYCGPEEVASKYKYKIEARSLVSHRTITYIRNTISSTDNVRSIFTSDDCFCINIKALKHFLDPHDMWYYSIKIIHSS